MRRRHRHVHRRVRGRGHRAHPSACSWASCWACRSPTAADPYGWCCPSASRSSSAFGMMGLMVAKRDDLLQTALRDLGLLTRAHDRATETRDAQSGPRDLRRHQRDHRRPHRGHRRVGVPGGTLVVPRFVLGELQHIADDARPVARSRGRRGLDVLSVLQKDHRVDLELSDEDEPGRQGGGRQAGRPRPRRGGASSRPTTTSIGSRSSRASGS